MKLAYIIVGIASVVMIAAVIYGFSVVGSPFSRQAIAADETRISNFTSIRTAVNTYYSKNQKLPETLADLPKNSYTVLTDPKTSKQYDYSVADETSFKLCTTFGADSKGYDYSDTGNSTTHKKGYDCLTFSIPEYYIKTPVVSPTKIKMSYDGDVLTWDDQSKSSSFTVQLYFYDKKDVKIMSADAKTEHAYRPTFTNWSYAQIVIYQNGGYQSVTDKVENTKYKDCTKPLNALCYNLN